MRRSLAIAFLLAAACRPAPAPELGPAPQVEVSGCAAVRAGGVCELPSTRRLRVLVATTKDAVIDVRSPDGAVLTRARAALAGEVRLDVELPEGARRLEVTLGRGADASAPAIVPTALDATPEWARAARRARSLAPGFYPRRMLAIFFPFASSSISLSR